MYILIRVKLKFGKLFVFIVRKHDFVGTNAIDFN